MEDSIFKTRDFSHASILLSLGYVLCTLERGGQDFVRFVFTIDPLVAKNIWDKYWRREVLVDAKTLIDSIHEIKTRLHSEEGRV